MKWEEFLRKFSDRPLFHSSMLRIFDDDWAHIQIQLTRWSKTGKITQIRRGWYLIEKPYYQNNISFPMIANQVVHPSYISLEWALQYYQMIPESVPHLTSITTTRRTEFVFKNRLFIYHFIQPSLFTGYLQEKYESQPIFIAYPEKALFDKIYLFIRQEKFSIDWLRELRLQNLEEFNLVRFQSYLTKTKKPGLHKAIKLVAHFIKELQS